MRFRLLAILLMLVVASGAFSATQKVRTAAKPQMAKAQPAAPQIKIEPVPVMPGGKVMAETTMTQDDFLPIVKNWMSAVPTILCAVQKEESKDAVNAQQLGVLNEICTPAAMKELENAISGLQVVSFTVYEMPRDVNISTTDIFYSARVGLNSGWLRNMMINGNGFAFRLYTRQGFTGMVGYAVSGKKVMAFRTQGRVDLGTISRWASKLAPVLITVSQSEKKECPKPETPSDTILSPRY